MQRSEASDKPWTPSENLGSEASPDAERCLDARSHVGVLAPRRCRVFLTAAEYDISSYSHFQVPQLSRSVLTQLND